MNRRFITIIIIVILLLLLFIFALAKSTSQKEIGYIANPINTE